jgi:hypothetical protein
MKLRNIFHFNLFKRVSFDKNSSLQRKKYLDAAGILSEFPMIADWVNRPVIGIFLSLFLI